MLNDAPDPQERLGARQSTQSDLKSEVVWFPAAMLLLAFQVLVLMHGFGVPLPGRLLAAYVVSVILVGLCLSLLLVAIVRTSVLWRSCALTSLVAGVAADIFVATGAATGAMSDGVGAAVLVVVAWATLWSITGSQPRL